MNQESKINLIEKLGLMNLPEGDREALLEKTGDIVFQKILARAMEKLTNEDREAFEALFDREDTTEDVVLDFLQSKIPDLDSLVKDEISGFLSEADDIMSKISI